MDLDRLLRTEGLLAKKNRALKFGFPYMWAGIPTRIPVRENHLQDRAEKVVRKTIREKRLPQHAPDPTLIVLAQWNNDVPWFVNLSWARVSKRGN